jgi:hypothetical protein
VSAPVYLVLLHHPIINRHGKEVTTAVTNLDIHDLSRSARTFGLKGYFIVTPLEVQHELVGRILSHWRDPKSKEYHPYRFEAVSLVRLVKTFEDVKNAIKAECGLEPGQEPEVVLTDARKVSTLPKTVSYADYRAELERDPNRTRPVVVVLGTGYGVSESFYPEVHRILAPVYGPEGESRPDVDNPGKTKRGYNHLSVRAAGAIILDRLFGH